LKKRLVEAPGLQLPDRTKVFLHGAGSAGIRAALWQRDDEERLGTFHPSHRLHVPGTAVQHRDTHTSASATHRLFQRVSVSRLPPAGRRQHGGGVPVRTTRATTRPARSARPRNHTETGASTAAAATTTTTTAARPRAGATAAITTTAPTTRERITRGGASRHGRTSRPC
jgi:hypothetical protein